MVLFSLSTSARLADVRCKTKELPRRVALLDLDGVIIPPCPLVGQRIEAYVAKYCHLDVLTARQVNQVLYRTYGHTFAGLQKVYGMQESLQHFNGEVYDNLDMCAVKDWLCSIPVRQSMLAGRTLRASGMPYAIFTNAPHSWTELVLTSTGLGSLFPDMLYHSATLKPDPKLYSSVKDRIFAKWGRQVREIHFVDDSFVNLVPVLNDALWKPYYVNGQGITGRLGECTSVSDVAQAADLITRTNTQQDVSGKVT